MASEPFVILSQTVNVTASGTSAAVQIAVPNPPLNYKFAVRIRNTAPNEVFIRFGVDNTVTASTTTDMPIAPNSIEVVGVSDFINPSGPLTSLWVAVVSAAAAGAPTYFTLGKGL